MLISGGMVLDTCEDVVYGRHVVIAKKCHGNVKLIYYLGLAISIQMSHRLLSNLIAYIAHCVFVPSCMYCE